MVMICTEGMNYMNTELSDYISIATIIIAVVGGVFAFIQWRRTISLKRADYIRELTDLLRSEPEIRDTMQKIDYGIIWYDEKFHYSDIEKMVDRTLSFVSYICYLYENGIISEKEYCVLKYVVERTISNNQVQDYLYNLYHFTSRLSINSAFIYLFKYGEKNNKFDEDFYNNTSYEHSLKYHKRINI